MTSNVLYLLFNVVLSIENYLCTIRNYDVLLKNICSVTHFVKFSNNFTLVFNGVRISDHCGEKIKLFEVYGLWRGALLFIYCGVAHYDI